MRGDRQYHNQGSEIVNNRLIPEHMTKEQLIKYVAKLESKLFNATDYLRMWAYENLVKPPIDLRELGPQQGIYADENQLYIHKNGLTYRALESGDIHYYEFPPNGFRCERKWELVDE